VLMTLEEAFIDLTNSDQFREQAKLKNTLGGKYRQYLSRFKKGKLKSGAIVELLLANGYTITAGRVEKKN